MTSSLEVENQNFIFINNCPLKQVNYFFGVYLSGSPMKTNLKRSCSSRSGSHNVIHAMSQYEGRGVLEALFLLVYLLFVTRTGFREYLHSLPLCFQKTTTRRSFHCLISSDNDTILHRSRYLIICFVSSSKSNRTKKKEQEIEMKKMQ